MVLVLAAALVVGGCGNKEETTTEAATEGIYLDVGDLKYQVQISRIINPQRHRGPQLPDAAPGGHAAAQGRRGVVRRLDAGREHQRRQVAADRRATSRSATRRTTSSSRYAQIGNVFAYQPVDKLGPQAVLPNSESPARLRPDPGLADPLQADDRRRSRTARSSSASPARRTRPTSRPSTSTSSAHRGLEHGLGRRRGRLAARALADQQHGDRDARVRVGREADEPGVGVGLVLLGLRGRARARLRAAAGPR